MLVLKKLNQVFGVHSYQVAYKIETDLDSIKSNDTINATLKNTEQKEQQTTNMKVSTKQQTISRARKGTAKKSSWAGRTIKIKSRAKGEL